MNYFFFNNKDYNKKRKIINSNFINNFIIFKLFWNFENINTINKNNLLVNSELIVQFYLKRLIS